MAPPTLQKPKVVLFDMDDTVGVAQTLHTKALKAYLAEFRLELPKEIEAQIKEWTVNRSTQQPASDEYTVCHGVRSQVIALLAEHGHIVSEEQYYQAVTEHARTVPDGYTAFEGVLTWIKELREQGVKIGFVTDAIRQHAENGLLGMGVYDPETDVLVAREDSEGKKPYPGPVLEACKQLGVDPGPDVWMIDDAPQPAVSAGCQPLKYDPKGTEPTVSYSTTMRESGPRVEVPVFRNFAAIRNTYNAAAALGAEKKQGRGGR